MGKTNNCKVILWFFFWWIQGILVYIQTTYIYSTYGTLIVGLSLLLLPLGIVSLAITNVIFARCTWVLLG